MSDLIPILNQPIGEKSKPAVSARLLHDRLGIKKRFTDWLEQYTSSIDWRNGNDFSVFPLEVKNPEAGGRPGIDAALSIQMAEHIAMMTRTTKGRAIREYFREARDQRDAHLHMPRVKNPANQLIIDAVIRIDTLEQEQERQREALIVHQQALIDAQAKAIEALKVSHHAEIKADMALAETHRMTVEHFVLSNGLLNKYPYEEHRRISDWLADFCFQWGWEVRKEPVYGKPWTEENAYPLHAFSAWLRQEQMRFKQQSLRAIRRSAP